MIIKPRTLLAVGLFLLTCVAYLFYVQKPSPHFSTGTKETEMMPKSIIRDR